jgi:hypothetical protein
MEVLNKSLGCSFSRELIAMSLNSYNISKSTCSRFCYASAAMLTSLIVAPIEATVRFALALITSLSLIGHFVGGEKGKKFAAVPIKLLASAELSITTMIGILMIPYKIYKKASFLGNVSGNNAYAMNQTVVMSRSFAKPYQACIQ